MKKLFKGLFSIFLFLVLTSGILFAIYPKQSKKFLLESIATITPILIKSDPYQENKYGVHPLLYQKVEQMRLQLQKEGIYIKVIRGHRNLKEQARLYAQGRTTKGGIVTNAIPGLSFHNYGWAVDVVVFENGKPKWNNRHWDRIGEVGKSLGLTWGGDWKKLVDRPHFQLKIKDILLAD
ncbi:M15 family metallopeptidase [Sediminitomix flava]|uniref:D-alanyl-D-alanine carboxypeptidase-like protein n=1 Tax=Sediminitomix flava TaxID=379075 RepID=A0A315ZGN8_SEDFL|nr:M15 family metallopeptidase [Sediminitomix flava]PWJ44765.1 D-alanyl-D-alanine carboxypeptidase-like protein [Sediminitomix flava]